MRRLSGKAVSLCCHRCTEYLGKDKPIRPCSKLARCSPCYRFQRTPGLDGCALSRLGMNLEFPSQQACALFHTPDAEPFVLTQLRQIKSTTLVSHANLQSVTCHSQGDLRLLHTTVLLQIPKPFLSDAENTKGHVRIERAGDFIRCKVDLNALLGREFIAQGTNRRNKSEALERG